MARLFPVEFDDLIGELIAAHTLGKLQDKLVRSHAVVSRRRLGSAAALSHQLYHLTLGLEREGLVSQVVLALWEEHLGSKLDETAARDLEVVAEKINACLSSSMEVIAEHEQDLRAALREYRSKLSTRVGVRAAHVTMLTRALPEVARRIRELEATGEEAPTTGQ
ncbi:MAG TPA: hypothetical protein VI893_01150 [Thermoplasmata archaeon]|nr:hypothetical protein [Thermoplasmata archaeon]